MRIAIIDSNTKNNWLSTELEKLQFNYQLVTESYSSLINFLLEYKFNKFDLIFYCLETKNGLEDVEKLHYSYITNLVIVNTDKSYAYDAFKLGVFDYFSDSEGIDGLENILIKFNKRQLLTSDLGNESMYFAQHSGTIRVLISEINYIEANGIFCDVHTKAKQITINKSLGPIIEKMQHISYMFRASRSFVVNINEIERIDILEVDVYNVVFRNGEMLQLAKIARDRIVRMLKEVYSF